MALKAVRRIFVAFTLSLVCFVSCDSPLAPLPDGRPTELDFSFGGFFIGSVRWLLRGDTVVFIRTQQSGAADSSWVIPSDDDWQKFWETVDRAGIRRWRERYVAEGIVDGSGWQLRIGGGTFRLESVGNNAYPDREGREHELEQTPEFQLLMGAFQALDASNSVWVRPARRVTFLP